MYNITILESLIAYIISDIPGYFIEKKYNEKHPERKDMDFDWKRVATKLAVEIPVLIIVLAIEYFLI